MNYSEGLHSKGSSNIVLLYFKYHYSRSFFFCIRGVCCFCMNESGPHQKLWLVMSKFHMADLDTLKLYENPETDLIDPLRLTRKYFSMDMHTDVVMIFANVLL